MCEGFEARLRCRSCMSLFPAHLGDIIYVPIRLATVSSNSDGRKGLRTKAAAPESRHLLARSIPEVINTGICLVLSDRKKHCETLQGILRFKFGVHAERLTGDVKDEERRRVLDRLQQGNVPALIATGQLIGEGFDCPDLATLFMATPIRFSGRVMQYLGRILRPAKGKARARVYDYVDVQVPPLVSAAKARQRVYGAHAGEMF